MSDRSSLLRETHSLVSGTLRLADPIIVASAALGAYWLRYQTLDMPFYVQAAVLLGVVLSVNFFQLAQVYRINLAESVTLQIVPTTVAWIGVSVVLTGLALVADTLSWFSRGWALSWFILSIAGFLGVRVVVLTRLWQMRESGRLRVRVAVVGARGELVRALIRQTRQSVGHEIQLVGIYDDLPHLPFEIDGVPVRGTVDDLVNHVRRERIDEIVLAMIERSEAETEQVLAKLRPVPVNTKLLAHSLKFNMPVRDFTSFSGLPLLHVFEKPLSGWGGVLKAVEDRVLGFFMLLGFLPVMAVIAVLIKLDSPGPVLFRQKRYGFNNDDIVVFKFRSMRNDPNPDPNVPQAQKNDPRITRIGAFIRKTSLDELPQLFNVLLGNMSLVGPRPHAVAHNEHYAKIIDGYLGRHRVKPGITGWAQINGYRGETDTPEKMRLRVQYDLYYIDNWSLILDLKILVLTIFNGFVNKNAY